MGPQGLTGRHTYHPQSFCSHCLWVPPMARSPCPSLPSASVVRSTVLCWYCCTSLSVYHGWALLKLLRGHCVASPRQSSWLPCFGLGEALSCKISIAIPPGGHPDASGARPSRLPSPAASSHTQGCSKHHSAQQCSREEVPGCGSGMAAGCSLLLSVRICHKMGY